jgi:hypothetical protein
MGNETAASSSISVLGSRSFALNPVRAAPGVRERGRFQPQTTERPTRASQCKAAAIERRGGGQRAPDRPGNSLVDGRPVRRPGGASRVGSDSSSRSRVPTAGEPPKENGRRARSGPHHSTRHQTRGSCRSARRGRGRPRGHAREQSLAWASGARQEAATTAAGRCSALLRCVRRDWRVTHEEKRDHLVGSCLELERSIRRTSSCRLGLLACWLRGNAAPAERRPVRDGRRRLLKRWSGAAVDRGPGAPFVELVNRRRQRSRLSSPFSFQTPTVLGFLE